MTTNDKRSAAGTEQYTVGSFGDAYDESFRMGERAGVKRAAAVLREALELPESGPVQEMPRPADVTKQREVESTDADREEVRQRHPAPRGIDGDVVHVGRVGRDAGPLDQSAPDTGARRVCRPDADGEHVASEDLRGGEDAAGLGREARHGDAGGTSGGRTADSSLRPRTSEAKESEAEFLRNALMLIIEECAPNEVNGVVSPVEKRLWLAEETARWALAPDLHEIKVWPGERPTSAKETP